MSNVLQDREVDRIVETWGDKLWEQLNVDPYPMWDNAVYKLSDVVSLLNKAESKLYEAADFVKESPEEDRLVSLAMAVSELAEHILHQKNRMKEVR